MRLIQPCFAELSFAKFDDGTSSIPKEFFGDYEVRLSLQSRDLADNSTQLKWTSSAPQILSIREPKYDASIVNTLFDS